MKYTSTRSNSAHYGLKDVLLNSYAPDGGLFVPAQLPSFSAEVLEEYEWLAFDELAKKLLQPFCVGDPLGDRLDEVVHRAYGSVRNRAVAPLHQTGSNEWILEAFHGPAGVYQDFGMQLLANLLEMAMETEVGDVLLLGCTGGDTGLAAFAGRPGMKLVILYPKFGIDPLQQARLLSHVADNVTLVPVTGDYADCHRLC